ncbi:hypothetical protein [Micromonospora carbonacea]|uniref:hypothetical protein n=1 Tax=Micromonospora carbonacea TaxID=47853 RepID=UPI0037180E4D
MAKPGQAQIGRNRPEQVLLHQAHALDHFENIGAVSVLGIPRAAICANGFPNPPTRTTLRCPLCLDLFPIGEMTEEHVPPRGGQSSLTSDGPRVHVYTCRHCNNTSGKTFEGDVSDTLGLDEADVPELACGVHGNRHVEKLPSGLLVMARDLPFAMTDYKASYLIGFATLGHRWAADHALDPVRDAIASYAAPDPKHGYLARMNNPTKVNFVYEVRSPQPCTIVHSAGGVAAVMPLPGHDTVPVNLDGLTISMRTYRWPDMYAEQVNPRKPHKPPRKGHHSLVPAAMRDGFLFHGDMCLSHVWADPSI